MGSPKEEWLKELKPSIRWSYNRRFDQFCKWLGKTDSELVEEYKTAEDKDQWARRMGNLLVQYYQERLNQGYRINTARSDVIAPRSFFKSQCREIKIPRGKISKPQIAVGEHYFSQDELKKMFYYGDTRGKAMLSTAVSLGWSSIDFLNLERSFIEQYVKKAKSENLEFVQFLYQREKTGETIICHLMPETIESLDAYLKVSPQEAKFLWYSPSDYNKPLSNYALNDALKQMVKQASIVTTGDVKFNEIRKFTFSTLQRFGMTESESRVCVGKTVSPDVLTYLINLKDTLLEKYKKAYEGLSLIQRANGRIGNLEKMVEIMSKAFANMLMESIREEMRKIGYPSFMKVTPEVKALAEAEGISQTEAIVRVQMERAKKGDAEASVDSGILPDQITPEFLEALINFIPKKRKELEEFKKQVRYVKPSEVEKVLEKKKGS